MNRLQLLQEQIGVHLDAIRRHFKPGSKVTLVVRQPDVPGDASVVIGNDDLDAAIAEIELRKLELSGTTINGEVVP